MNDRLVSFVGGDCGNWTVRRIQSLVGEPIASVETISVDSTAYIPANAAWVLRGVTSNERYVEREEKTKLVASQEGLGRPGATCAALIPIRKNTEWWSLTQDERRAIFEAQSQHIAIGMRYLPAIARRLHHCRDLGEKQDFDFLTWFEYAPEHETLFDQMLIELHASPEWRYVDREIDIRLERTGA